MTPIVAILVSILSPLFAPTIGFSDVDVEGSNRFGMLVEDPREMADEETFVWSHCP